MTMSDRELYFYLIIGALFYFIAGYILRLRGMKMTQGVYCGLAIVSVLIFQLPLFLRSSLPLKLKIYITISVVAFTAIYGLVVRIVGKTLKVIIKPEGKHKSTTDVESR